MFLSFFRIIKFSLQDIFRNIWLSIVTILIMSLALFSINLLLSVRVISSAAVGTIKEKIDINLYLKSESAESDIMALRVKINNLTEVREVKYISQAEALEQFKLKHGNEPELMQALKELDLNPLSPSLVIKPKDTDQYEILIEKLNKIDDPVIESRNFDNHRTMLSKIDDITKKVSEAGLIVSAIFAFITLLVIYNTIRVAIYTHREEIMIMKLVGASNWFIKAPFLISSIVYTAVSLIIVTAIFFVFLTLLQPYLETFFLGYNVNILTYFTSKFFFIFGIEFIIASVINMLASLVAAGKYSNI